MKIKTVQTVEVELDLDALARLFAHLDDHSQAQFFCKVAEIAEQDYSNPQETQWCYVGRHLRTCECATDAGRDVIRHIYEAMEHD